MVTTSKAAGLGKTIVRPIGLNCTLSYFSRSQFKSVFPSLPLALCIYGSYGKAVVNVEEAACNIDYICRFLKQ